MAFDEAQQDVEKWVSQFKTKYFSNEQIFLQMEEEAGEIARILNYMNGTKKPKEGEKIESLGAESVDLLFAIMCLANANGIDLNEERKKMMEKKRYKRDNNRFEKKE